MTAGKSFEVHVPLRIDHEVPRLGARRVRGQRDLQRLGARPGPECHCVLRFARAETHERDAVHASPRRA